MTCRWRSSATTPITHSSMTPGLRFTIARRQPMRGVACSIYFAKTWQQLRRQEHESSEVLGPRAPSPANEREARKQFLSAYRLVKLRRHVFTSPLQSTAHPDKFIKKILRPFLKRLIEEFPFSVKSVLYFGKIQI